MFNSTIPASNFARLQARLSKQGVATEVEQRWTMNGTRYLDVVIAPDATRYSVRLARLVEQYEV